MRSMTQGIDDSVLASLKSFRFIQTANILKNSRGQNINLVTVYIRLWIRVYVVKVVGCRRRSGRISMASR